LTLQDSWNDLQFGMKGVSSCTYFKITLECHVGLSILKDYKLALHCLELAIAGALKSISLPCRAPEHEGVAAWAGRLLNAIPWHRHDGNGVTAKVPCREFHEEQ